MGRVLKGKSALWCSLIVAGCFTSLLFANSPASATAGINSQLSFEGKVVNTNGTNIADGTHNVEFKIYQDGTSSGVGSTLLWTEDWLVAGSTGMPSTGGVTFTSGTYQVNLGSICAVAGGTCGAKTNTGVDFNQQTLWLSLQVGNTSSCTVTSSTTSFNTACGGDGEMTPFIRLTSTPYAFNSDKLDGIDSTAFGQLASNQTWTGTNTIALANTAAFKVQNASFNVFNVDTSTDHVKILDGTATQGSLDLSYNDGSSSGIITASAALVLNSTTTSAITLDSGTTGNVNVGTGGNAKTVAIGNQTGGTTLNLESGSGNVNLMPSAANDVVFSEGAGSNLQITASAAPTIDQVAVSNAGQGTSTTGIDGLAITYETAGTTNSADNAGLRVDVTSNDNGTTTTLEGLKIGNLSSAEANSTETGLYVGTGWDVGLNLQSGGLQLATMTDPVAPAADNLRVYAQKVSGRMLLKIKGPSGLDSPLQPALFGNNAVLFAPNSAAVGTGTGFGTIWQSNGTVSHPVPATTAPALANQIHRTRYANIVTTTNQVLGPKVNTTSENDFWTGNAAGLGGFFFNTRFVVDLWPAATVRLFAGLSSSTTAVVASDTVAGDVVGLWHDTTDAATTFNLVTRNNTTTTKTAITVSNAIAAGNAYDFYMFCKPNDTTIFYRLDDLVNGVTYEGSTSTTLPRNTIFMGPQVEMSNGTANTTVTTVGIGVARIYVESDK
ncbi:MAG TPA: hypothetical protein VLH84_02540 [Patescibacteria group bacterium]|nr:hypothetical protein [Patescibacteria group bacterium]